ncbi:MAG: chemotaxis protein CheB [Myxococcales bacterium]|nr:chemotaxis protein CheB [Myxococcales bacterium]
MSGVRPECVVVGGSAGALEVLNAVFPALPRGFPLPVLTVIHQPEHGSGVLARLFRGKCEVDVSEAEHGQPLTPGICFGPAGYHLAVEPTRTLSLSLGPPVWFSRPAIDVLFESAAWTFGSRSLAILLSGASEDGARGLATLRAAGGVTWVQEPSTALARTMPEAGLRLGGGQEILSPGQMAARLRGLGTEAT